MLFNPLHCIDFYKTDHRRQYPAGTELVVSNFTPRSGKHANVPFKGEIVFFGLQYFLLEFIQDTWNALFFELPKEDVLAIYKHRMDTSLGNTISIDHIAALHDLGYLPIEIKAVPEGTLVPVGVPCLTIHNTLPEFFWLTNYLETILSAYMWLPCTSATTAYNYRKLLDGYCKVTGSPEWFTDIQAHDFSFRGMSSLQSAALSGAAHLLCFTGTDTVPAIDFHEIYYGADGTKEMIGGSIPATEHSVMCMGGEEDELGTFRRLITELYPKGLISIVSDTWDFWKVLSEYSVTLKEEILARDGKVVFRPDSGDPVRIICGLESDSEHDPVWAYKSSDVERMGAVELLWEIFGGTITDTGYKLLDPHVGLIYGDSITYDVAEEILRKLKLKGFASGNIVFGVGSYTYQYVTRDTWGWAVKATYGIVNGEPREIFKKPKTDAGEKNSAKGLLFVDKDSNGKLALAQGVSWEKFNSPENLLQTVFKNGQRHRIETLSGIRARLKSDR